MHTAAVVVSDAGGTYRNQGAISSGTYEQRTYPSARTLNPAAGLSAELSSWSWTGTPAAGLPMEESRTIPRLLTVVVVSLDFEDTRTVAGNGRLGHTDCLRSSWTSRTLNVGRVHQILTYTSHRLSIGGPRYPDRVASLLPEITGETDCGSVETQRTTSSHPFYALR